MTRIFVLYENEHFDFRQQKKKCWQSLFGLGLVLTMQLYCHLSRLSGTTPTPVCSQHLSCWYHSLFSPKLVFLINNAQLYHAVFSQSMLREGISHSVRYKLSILHTHTHKKKPRKQHHKTRGEEGKRWETSGEREGWGLPFHHHSIRQTCPSSPNGETLRDSLELGRLAAKRIM